MCLKGHLRTGLWVLILALPVLAQAQGIPMVNVSGGAKGTQYSLTLQVLALMTSLTLLPSFLLMMTSFVRIIIVMSLLRQALGTGQTPPNQVLVGLALFAAACGLTVFVGCSSLPGAGISLFWALAAAVTSGSPDMPR